MSKKELTKEVEHALKWLATEFIFLKRLHSDLQRIENDDIKTQEKELRKDRKVVRYIGRAERRLEKDVNDIVEDIKEAKKIEISESRVKQLLNEIEIPANQLVKEGSQYLGSLKQQLSSIRTDVEIEQKYPSTTKRDEVRREIEKLNSEVEKVISWLVTLDVALKKVEHLTTNAVKIIELPLEEYSVATMEEFTSDEQKNAAFQNWGQLMGNIVVANFSGERVVGRVVSVDDHPGTTPEELVNIILEYGTDRYTKDRKGKGDQHVTSKFDFYGFPIHVKGNLNFSRAIASLHDIPIKYSGKPLRIDIIILYKSDLVRVVPYKKRGRDMKDAYQFLDQNQKPEALRGIIKVLR
jgi:hypothetical protein